MAQLDLAPTLAVFASRSVISTPPRFARDFSAHGTLAVFVETHWLRTSDAERDAGVSRKPSCDAIRESRIASSPRDKMIDSNDARILALRAARLSRSIPMGSIDSAASRILALRAARLSHHVPSISIRSLQLIQAFGRPSTLPWAPVRNWSSLFLNRMSDV